MESVYTGNRIVGSNPTPSATDATHIGSPGSLVRPFWPSVPFFRRGTYGVHGGRLACFYSLTGLFSPELCTTAIWYKAPQVRIYGHPLGTELESHSRRGFYDQSVSSPFRAVEFVQIFCFNPQAGPSPLSSNAGAAHERWMEERRYQSWRATSPNALPPANTTLSDAAYAGNTGLFSRR